MAVNSELTRNMARMRLQNRFCSTCLYAETRVGINPVGFSVLGPTPVLPCTRCIRSWGKPGWTLNPDCDEMRTIAGGSSDG